MAAALLPGSAWAGAVPPITVEREAGAEDCPDTAGLVTRVEAIIGRGSTADATPYRVTFSRSTRGFSAAIRAGAPGTTVRYLDAHEPNCAALAHATAIALAVLFDADLGGTSEPPQEEPEAAAAAAPPAPAEPPAQKPAHSKKDDEADTASSDHASTVRVDPLFAIGAAALAGVLRPAVFALVADAGIEVERFRGTIGAVWVSPQMIDLPPGSARENLFSGSLRACYAVSRGGVLRLDLCTGALVGAATADARGFTTHERHTELFLAVPLELSVSARSRFIGWQLGASALAVLPPNEFEVAGVGLTYRPPPVAGMFALRLFWEPRR